eukprot:Opistho-1_new@75492
MRIIRLRRTPVAVAVALVLLVSLGFTLDSLLRRVATPGVRRIVTRADREPVPDAPVPAVPLRTVDDDDPDPRDANPADIVVAPVLKHADDDGAEDSADEVADDDTTGDSPDAQPNGGDTAGAEADERSATDGSGEERGGDGVGEGPSDGSADAAAGDGAAAAAAGGGETWGRRIGSLADWYAHVKRVRALWWHGDEALAEAGAPEDACRLKGNSPVYVVHSEGPVPCAPYEFESAPRSGFVVIGGATCFGRGMEKAEGQKCVCKEGWSGDSCDTPAPVRASAGRVTLARTRPVRIVDSFNFNMEVDLLRIRLEELRDVVDVHVIVESTVSFAGVKKPLRFLEIAADVIRDFGRRIIYVVIDAPPPASMKGDGFAQYNVGYSAPGQLGVPVIAGLTDGDLIMFTDLDEIPDAGVLGFLREHAEGLPLHTSFLYRWSYYGFMWRNQRGVHLSSLVTLRHLRSALQWDTLKVRGRPAQFDSSSWIVGVEGTYAGWHCSWCFPVPDFVVKLDSAIHGDYPRWGDYPEKKEMGYLRENKRLGRWFDGSVGGRLTSPATDPYFAPQWATAHRAMFEYLFDNTQTGERTG